MRPLALKYRIAATIFVLAATVMGLVVWQTLASSLGAAGQQRDAAGAVTLSLLEDLGRRSLLTGEHGVLQLQIDRTLADPHIARVVVADHTGLIVAATEAAWVGTALGRLPGEPGRVWKETALRAGSTEIGRLAVQVSGTPVAVAVRQALVRGLPVALAGVALLAVVSVVIGHLLTRRLEGLREAGQLERQVAELRLVRSAVEHTQDAVVITTGRTDRDGPTILYVNPAFVALTGHAAGDVTGRTPRFLRGATQDRAGLAALREAVAAGRSWIGEVAIRRRDGSDVPVDLRIAPVRDGTGRLASWVATCRDLTPHRQAEAAQAQLEQELRQAQKMEAVGQLTGGLAHDFNNLLTVVLGNLGQAVEELPEGAPARRMIERAVVAGERGAQLTRRLLAFGRRQPHRPQPVDVARLIADMSEMLRRTLGEPIDLRLVGPTGLWTTECDRAQLETALLNLAINARDAMPLGGRLVIATSNVVLDAAMAAARGGLRPGDYVSIAVGDTGIGMPPHVAARAFEPFFTTKEVGQGSGLGLSMVYGFVQQAGGHVQITSEVSRGTTVRLILPRSPQAEPPAPAVAAQRTDAAPGAGRILLVEDDPDVREVAATLLADLGYRVERAASGQEALALLERGAPADLLFTDVVLPGGMSGRDLAVQARARRPTLRVLYTSGYTVEEIQSQDPLATRIPLLVKPFRREELAAMVREALDPVAGGR